VREGWQTKRLGDVATLQRGFDLPTQNRVAGEFPLVSSSGISDAHHKCAVRGPGVVTGRSGSIGNVFFVEEDFWPLNTVLYVKDFHGNDPRFVFHLLKKFDLQRFASGAGVPTLNRNCVHDELLSVPPLPEQKRIVAILDEAFEGIAAAAAKAEKNLANARELFESYLNSVFTQKGKGWVEKRLGGSAAISYGYTAKASFAGDGPKFLRITDIQNGGVDWSTVPTCPINEDELRRHQLFDGDIVFARTGATTGKSYLLSSPPDSIAASYLIRCRLNDKNLLAPYVALYFQTRAYWENISKGTTGSAQGGFNASKLANLMIPNPPLSEQKRIIAGAVARVVGI
jgi:type I restriction enzyme, S subunit